MSNPIVVIAAIIEKNGKWLIARRKPEKKMGGLWEFPGGKLEPNETPEQCLMRELREELNIETSIGKMLTEAHFRFQNNAYHIIAYEATHLQGDITLIDHDDLAWVNPSELQHYALTPADADIVEFLTT